MRTLAWFVVAGFLLVTFGPKLVLVILAAWFVAGVIVGLVVGRLLRRRSAEYPPPMPSEHRYGTGFDFAPYPYDQNDEGR